MNLKIILIIPMVLTGSFILLYKIYKRKQPDTFYYRMKKKRSQIPMFQVLNISVCNNNTSLKVCLYQTISMKTIYYRLCVNYIWNNTLKISIKEDICRYSISDSFFDDTISPDGQIFVQNLGKYKLYFRCAPFELLISENELVLARINGCHFLQLENRNEERGVSIDILVPGAEHIYGLPLRPTSFSLKPTNNSEPYRLYNSDNFAYTKGNQPLYGSVPILYAHNLIRTVGIVWLNASETFVDIYQYGGSKCTVFTSESGCLEFFILTGPTLRACIKQNSQLTGVTPLPPIFSLGYHQSRYSYKTQKEVVDVCTQLDQCKFPFDSIWLDIDYTDDKRIFTWNRKNFPNPRKLAKFLKRNKRHLVTIIDPHVKIDNDYKVYREYYRRNHFVKKPNFINYQDKCWPGECCWIDFFDDSARSFYIDSLHRFVIGNNHHIWIDMNEPSVFNNEKTLPKSLLHAKRWTHRDVHNLYGHYHAKSTYQGLLNHINFRPFILTRSHFIGTQKFAAIWTGDNIANWEHLSLTIPMCLSESIVGFSFCGSDIGGFVGNPSSELLQRWYQLGAWLPFFRQHSNNDTEYREPYRFNCEIQQRIRNAINQRYHHLLYWYTLFYQHSINYEPVIRPLVYHYPNDSVVFDIDNEFLIGSDILLCPVLEEQVKNIQIYIPGIDYITNNNDIWYFIEHPNRLLVVSGGTFVDLPVDLDTVPLFYKGGSIVPIFTEIGRNTKEIWDKSISLFIFLSQTKSAIGFIYKDDGLTFAYKKNKFTYIEIQFKDDLITNRILNKYHQRLQLSSIFIYNYERLNFRNATLNGTRSVCLKPFEKFIEICSIDTNLAQDFVLRLSE